MRKSFSRQRRLDCSAIEKVLLNLACRDEIIPILSALQHIYSQHAVRDEIMGLIAQDVNEHSRRDIGREGFDDWHILVLAAVRLGCNLNYDKLQDLAEQHRALRQIMGIGDWDDQTSFNWRRMRNTLCRLKPETIDRISQIIVQHGHDLCPDAVMTVRVDSFVVETNIHYPTESSLILDGMGRILPLCAMLADQYGLAGWRQHEQLLRRIKNLAMTISRISASKSQKKQQRLNKEYAKLITRARRVLSRAKELQNQLADQDRDVRTICQLADLQWYMEATEQVCGTAYRRVILGETVPNEEKLFSLFEPHTQLYRRGKAGKPNQFGRLTMVYEDGAGFITHYHILPRDAQDADVVVEQTRIAQERHGGQIETASFDRGFYSSTNEEQLRKVIEYACLPKKSPAQFAQQLETASVHFRQARQRHPGIESAIGALQAGNGLARCRDHSELGFRRYIALGVLGRNLHVLGKLLIQQNAPESKAAHSQRKSAA